MIAYVETRLVLDAAFGEFVSYSTNVPEAAAVEVVVRRAVFEGEPPHEIILTVTPA